MGVYGTPAAMNGKHLVTEGPTDWEKALQLNDEPLVLSIIAQKPTKFPKHCDTMLGIFADPKAATSRVQRALYQLDSFDSTILRN